MAAPPDIRIVARQALEVFLAVVLIVIIGTIARSLYVAIVRPTTRVTKPRESLAGLAISAGLVAVVADIVFTYTGIKKRHCANQAP